MSNDVFVRFVPRSRQGVARVAFDGVLAPAVAKAFTPDAKNSERAQIALASRNVTAFRTPQNRLESRMSAQQFTEMFGAKVKRVESLVSMRTRPRDRFSKHETFLQPQSEIEIPDALERIPY